MPRTAAQLPRHELIGLAVRVSDATDPDLVGIEGTVLDETTNTLVIGVGGRTWQVPKAVATFEFELPDSEADDPDASGSAVVTVEGKRLVARPARRTERRGDSTWR
ncbi:ribonuclease P protein component 1 [Halorhabdus amylolytica]|uniref:ribonuclease P protein component 1 n=1 Tax=Halorhabdus amylolytica TaxID=2559573 RepID=UPI0010AB4D6F|nr:ribonuclease P protein component 1 [Halorhabdus amylolytica]